MYSSSNPVNKWNIRLKEVYMLTPVPIVWDPFSFIRISGNMPEHAVVYLHNRHSSGNFNAGITLSALNITKRIAPGLKERKVNTCRVNWHKVMYSITIPHINLSPTETGFQLCINPAVRTTAGKVHRMAPATQPSFRGVEYLATEHGNHCTRWSGTDTFSGTAQENAYRTRKLQGAFS
jgi:hypothetical protein